MTLSLCSGGGGWSSNFQVKNNLYVVLSFESSLGAILHIRRDPKLLVDIPSLRGELDLDLIISIYFYERLYLMLCGL